MRLECELLPPSTTATTRLIGGLLIIEENIENYYHLTFDLSLSSGSKINVIWIVSLRSIMFSLVFFLILFPDESG